MAPIRPRVPYTVVPLGPVCLGEPPAGGVAAFVGGEPGGPQQARRAAHRCTSTAYPGRAGPRGPAGDDRSCGRAECRQPGQWLAWAQSIVTELDEARDGVGERPTAYLMIVFPQSDAPRPAAGRAATPWRPRPLDRAIKIMEADPAENLTMADLARATNVSVRTLQAVFRQHTGTSPMYYLRQLRLARAHRDLLAADPRRDTVARIAHRWAFPHLGRFAATYRARYGYNPSTTLRIEPTVVSPDGSPPGIRDGSPPGIRGVAS